MDRELDNLLDSYKVADADDKLLETIVGQAAATKVLVFKRPSRMQYFENTAFKAVAVFSITALLGFWLGDSSYQPNIAGTSTSKQATTLNQIIAPTSLDEIKI